MLGLPGGIEWIIILIIALLLFGKRLPNVMRSLGQGVKEFKRGVNTVEDEVNGIDEEDSSGHLPEGGYEDEYTEEGYRQQEPEAGTTEEAATEAPAAEEPAAEEPTAEEPAAPNTEDEEQAAADTGQTSKPAD